MAWYAHGGGNGRPLGAMRIAMKSPQTPDCRGGVFAVFAKIPPPTCPPHARILSRPPFPVVISRMVMSARVVFVATRRAASRLRITASRCLRLHCAPKHRSLDPHLRPTDINGNSVGG